MLTCTGALCDFFAFSLAPQSVVTAVGAVTLAVNLIFGRLFLNEKPTTRSFAGTLAILVGAGVVVSTAQGDTSGVTIATLVETLGHWLTWLYVGIAALLAAACLVYLRRVRRARAGLPVADATQPTQSKSMAIAWALLAGNGGAQNTLFAKACAELLQTTVQGDNQLVNPATYLLAALLVASIIVQQHALARALTAGAATTVYPIFQAAFISISVASGGMVYGEFRKMSPLALVGFALGVAVIIAGVVALAGVDTKGTAPPTPPEGDDSQLQLGITTSADEDLRGSHELVELAIRSKSSPQLQLTVAPKLATPVLKLTPGSPGSHARSAPAGTRSLTSLPDRPATVTMPTPVELVVAAPIGPSAAPMHSLQDARARNFSREHLLLPAMGPTLLTQEVARIGARLAEGMRSLGAWHTEPAGTDIALQLSARSQGSVSPTHAQINLARSGSGCSEGIAAAAEHDQHASTSSRSDELVE